MKRDDKWPVANMKQLTGILRQKRRHLASATLRGGSVSSAVHFDSHCLAGKRPTSDWTRPDQARTRLTSTCFIQSILLVLPPSPLK
jgi:hypothetical protein